MAELEKVIRGLECQYEPRMTCYGCEYFIARDKLCNKNKIFREAVDLLKAQEPKPPRFAVAYDKIFYACDNCGKSLLVVLNAEGVKSLGNMPKYCPECGQAVKWDEPPKEET